MDIKINSKAMKITDGMRQATKERLNVLSKFLSDSEVIRISVEVIRKEIKVCVMVTYENKLIKITQAGDDYYSIMGDISDRMKEKFEKLHSKKIKRLKDQANALDSIDYDYEPDEEEFMNEEIIAKTKKIVLVPMSKIEAIKEMNELGHESFIFLNKENNKHCMIYTRNDGKYGLIETD